MINKPVAWMREDGVIAFHKQKEIDSQGFKWQPLYTALQTKPLSDAEIMKLLNGIEYNPAEVETSFDYEIRIARAIEERHGIK